MIKSGPGVPAGAIVRVARSIDSGDTWSVVADLPFTTRLQASYLPALLRHEPFC